jgi:outer membrane receptor protein involved in Fe transport
MRLILLVFLIYFVTGFIFSVKAQESGSNQDQKKDEITLNAGQIQGTVKDALGKPLAGVTLRLQSADGQVVSQTQSDKDGQFTFAGIAPGTYAVEGEKAEFQSGTAIVTLTSETGASTTLTLKANKALEMALIEKRLERARNGLSPETGSSIYRLDQKDISNLPQGVQTPMNQVLLQVPGVVQDSFGQLHVRGEHANLQYRLNGILLPEGITGFGQTLDTRFADRINFLTGALPAQYGYRTAGVVDIHTKEGAFVNGERVDVYGGSYSDIEPSVEFGGSKGSFNYYVTASYLQNDFGVESPTPTHNPIHDHTQQGKGFGYFSYLLNSTSRLSLILGDAESRFEIPNNPGQLQQFNLNGVCTVPVPPGPCNVNSANLDENQREANRYGVLALQGTAGSQFDYQIAFFSRYSEVVFEPDRNGDLVFNGVASRVERSSFTNGLQGDSSYRLNESHMVRTGFFVSGERAISDNTSSVFSTDTSGNQNSNTPIQPPIMDNNGKTAWLYGLYLQDEWRPTDKVTVNYGVRADLINAYVNASQVSPRLGAVYQATLRTTLHAGYARYFTPPPTELVAPTDLALFNLTTNAPPCAFTGPPCQDSNVLPERSHYFDAGVTHQLTPSLSLGLDGYYKIVHNLLDEGQFGQALVFTPFNYKDGKVYGVEFTGTYKKDNFSSYLNIAYSKAMGRDIVSSQFDIAPDELAYIANHYIHLDHDQTVTSSAGASYLWAGTNFTVDALYGSGLRKGFANTDVLKDNLQVNLGLTHGVVVPHVGRLEGRFIVLNLFDRVNELRDGTGVGVGAPQFATRRAFYGGVNLAF